MENNNKHITILGAGAIGCYLAGCLLAKKINVRMIGRDFFYRELDINGLTISDYTGRSEAITGSIDYHIDEAAVADSSLILLCVKSADTLVAARQITRFCPDATVISFQNGVQNVSRLLEYLLPAQVIPAMVPYNVMYRGKGCFHQATEGVLHFQTSPALEPWIDSFRHCFGRIKTYENLESVQWSKLLLNLNNPINALCDLPLRQELAIRQYRRQLADCIEEGLLVMKGKNIKPVKLGKLPVHWLPAVLRFPDWLFHILARSMLSMDAQARSSMWQDIQRGRVTEIEDLNGEIMRQATDLDLDTPIVEGIYHQVKALEKMP